MRDHLLPFSADATLEAAACRRLPKGAEPRCRAPTFRARSLSRPRFGARIGRRRHHCSSAGAREKITKETPLPRAYATPNSPFRLCLTPFPPRPAAASALRSSPRRRLARRPCIACQVASTGSNTAAPPGRGARAFRSFAFSASGVNATSAASRVVGSWAALQGW
ncbi:hypothetical protein BS78_02G318300 [Paspalum vaginatum]|nr:hypothetical protein BS78_02G318300 [Paspalum vaginatum]